MKGKIRKKILQIFVLFLVYSSTCINLSSQVTDYKFFYRVYFKDKGDVSPDAFSPESLLSPRAISRRAKNGIPVPLLNDLPVSSDYINQIRSKGFTIHSTSKWLNTALFKTQNQADINLILALPFVSEVKIVKEPVTKSNYSGKLDFQLQADNNPPFDSPLTMLNGRSLHNSGYDGSGVLIAVLDGGFIKADLISSLNNLRARRGIKGTRDFVSGGKMVYGFHYHGTAVLSVLAGSYPGYIEGSAPGADYILIRTEDTATEFPVEEDFWAAGAEYADSIGADIISSSLGYSTFDNPTMNYKFSDMNGQNTFVTQAANCAASKGILVVNSAGNERTNQWKRIIAPSDGFNVVATGAVDWTGLISAFSSAGPSADKRIKPDNATQGVNVPVQINPTSFSRADGTSFSCPILSGMCACVMQAVPKALNTDLTIALHKNGNMFNKPDSLYGYGIPDLVRVFTTLQELYTPKTENESTIGPNPFTREFEVTFKNVPGALRVIITTSSGKVILNRFYREYISRTLKINDLQYSHQGIYLITLITNNGTFNHKVLKLNN